MKIYRGDRLASGGRVASFGEKGRGRTADLGGPPPPKEERSPSAEPLNLAGKKKDSIDRGALSRKQYGVMSLEKAQS